MFNIANFFEKFTKLHKNTLFIKETIRSLAKDRAGVNLNTEDIDLQEGKVYLKCSPVMRNQIFMYKEIIENSLKSQKIFLKIY